MILPSITREDLETPDRLAGILADTRNYYWTLDWSPEFYIRLAQCGFISISTDIPMLEGVRALAPEMQAAYAVLDWENLHISRSMETWMRSATFRDLDLQLQAPGDLEAVIAGIAKAYPDNNWMRGQYVDLLRELDADGPWKNFELFPVTLTAGDGRIVAGEIGYRIGRVYTSLSGFFDRTDPAFSNTGKLQLYWLSQRLRDDGFAFWNLGHPYMQYKLDLGAEILPREDFLPRWFESTKQ